MIVNINVIIILLSGLSPTQHAVDSEPMYLDHEEVMYYTSAAGDDAMANLQIAGDDTMANLQIAGNVNNFDFTVSHLIVRWVLN